MQCCTARLFTLLPFLSCPYTSYLSDLFKLIIWLFFQVKYREEYEKNKGRSQMEFGDTQMYKVSKEAQKMQSEVKPCLLCLSGFHYAAGLFINSTKQTNSFLHSDASYWILNFSCIVFSFSPHGAVKLSRGFLDCVQTKHLSLVFVRRLC